MSAWLIYFCHEFRDKPGHIAYSKAVAETLEGTGAKVQVAYTRFEMLEGDREVQGVVLIEFPTYQIAKAWYESAQYVAVRGHRIRNAYTGLLVDGGITPLMERFPDVI